VEDCTKMDVRHHKAQKVSPMRFDLRPGGRIRYLVVSVGLSGCVRWREQGID